MSARPAKRAKLAMWEDPSVVYEAYDEAQFDPKTGRTPQRTKRMVRSYAECNRCMKMMQRFYLRYAKLPDAWRMRVAGAIRAELESEDGLCNEMLAEMGEEPLHCPWDDGAIDGEAFLTRIVPDLMLDVFDFYEDAKAERLRFAERAEEMVVGGWFPMLRAAEMATQDANSL